MIYENRPIETLYILLPLPLLNGAYVYGMPPELFKNKRLQVGTFVQVPLSKKKIIGVVWHRTDDSVIDSKRIKNILCVYDCPPLPKDSIALITYISAYNICPLGAVLKMAMPTPDAISHPKTTICYTKSPNPPVVKITPKRQAVLHALNQSPPIPHTELMHKTGASDAIIRTMQTAGLIDAHTIPKMAKTDITPLYTTHPTPLNMEQQVAADTIKHAHGTFEVFALDGVTGSGKTETYFEAIAHTLLQNKQVLVLLPEIALSSQWEHRFYDRFGFKPLVWHSEISPKNRNLIWAGVLHGTVSVVVGARSALHMPFDNLGLIVVDEEHDGAYKQQDTVLYNARDMAIVRAKKNMCPIVLASATPSMESWANIVGGRYTHLKLSKRHSGTQVATYTPIDITTEKMDKDCFITPTLLHHMQATFDKGLQTLLFLNRRGYAPLSLCRACGYRFQCKNCDSWLIHHKYNTYKKNLGKKLLGKNTLGKNTLGKNTLGKNTLGKNTLGKNTLGKNTLGKNTLGKNPSGATLQCHHCAYTISPTNICPKCGATDTIHACGPGVERIYDEVQKHFPDAHIFIATADTMTTRKQARDFIENMQNGCIDIVIGTQIIAKGYDFENLHLVGVIDGDMALHGADLRAGETAFQLLHQVGGRVGRGNTEGCAFIQTANANHPVLQALMDNRRDTFLNTELQIRKIIQQPPFHRLANILVSGANPQLVEQTAKHLVHIAPHTTDMRILGPADPTIPLLCGKYRKKILVNAPKHITIQPILKNWIYGYQKPSTIRIQIDIDPYSFT